MGPRTGGLDGMWNQMGGGSKEKRKGRRTKARQRYGQAEEVQASSEGEMRGVRRTRPAGKAKEKVTEEKENTDAREEQETKEQCMSRTQ